MLNREINDEYILGKGYKEFKPTCLNDESVVSCFQKRFDDEVGKKYFIDIEKWYWGDVIQPHRRDTWYQDFTYEYSVQIYLKDTDNAIDITFLSSWHLDQVEEHMEKLFETGMYDYYERWDEC